MFALTSSLGLPVAAKKSARSARRRPAVIRAGWTIDGVGCADERKEGATVERLSRHVSNNVVQHCPVRPFDLPALCAANEGSFSIFDAVFDLEGDQLFVTNVDADNASKIKLDGKLLPKYMKTPLAPDAVLEMAGQRYIVTK
jgi:hypothetical protein